MIAARTAMRWRSIGWKWRGAPCSPTSPGGYLPGQWYRMTVISSTACASASMIGQRIDLEAVDPWRGGVGLIQRGKDRLVFDDVTVYGQTLDTDLLREIKQSHISQRFLDDNNGMKEWAVNPEQWQRRLDRPGLSGIRIYCTASIIGCI